MRDLILPVEACVLETLRAGEELRLTGVLAAARDAAHDAFLRTGSLPFDPAVIPVYYMGPTPAPSGRPCGSCGPTTSSRMEPFIPFMLERGMKIAIGKGGMSRETRKLFQDAGSVYMAAVGGAGALAAESVRSRRIIAMEHLGPEAVSLIAVEGFPVFVAWDLHGGNIFRRTGGLT